MSKLKIGSYVETSLQPDVLILHVHQEQLCLHSLSQNINKPDKQILFYIAMPDQKEEKSMNIVYFYATTIHDVCCDTLSLKKHIYAHIEY